MEENIAKIKLNLLDTKIKNYKYLIIGLENNECEIVKSPRNISEILNEKYSIKMSHMFFYRFFEKENYLFKENVLIKKLIW
jgi:hypothetical protein|tara:strand:- start:1384 stop:1626 length:243 start_codon:yes stop_codon:yes gene_type:complete